MMHIQTMFTVTFQLEGWRKVYEINNATRYDKERHTVYRFFTSDLQIIPSRGRLTIAAAAIVLKEFDYDYGGSISSDVLALSSKWIQMNAATDPLVVQLKLCKMPMPAFHAGTPHLYAVSDIVIHIAMTDTSQVLEI